MLFYKVYFTLFLVVSTVAYCWQSWGLSSRPVTLQGANYVMYHQLCNWWRFSKETGWIIDNHRNSRFCAGFSSVQFNSQKPRGINPFVWNLSFHSRFSRLGLVSQHGMTSSSTAAHSPTTLQAELSWKPDVNIQSRCQNNSVWYSIVGAHGGVSISFWKHSEHFLTGTIWAWTGSTAGSSVPREHSFMCFNLETHRSEIAYLNHRRRK